MKPRSARSFDDFRLLARALLQAGTPPRDVLWSDEARGQGALFGEEDGAEDDGREGQPARVPRAFVEIASVASHHRDPARFGLLYRVLWRLTHDEPRLLEIAADEDVVRLRAMAQAVRRDEHKMHAFVRFRRIETTGGERFVAFYAPDHLILPLAAPFFARRFPAMAWSILTPDGSAHWEGDEGDAPEAPARIVYGEGVSPREAPAPDELEDLFRTYYEAIFNPARVNKAAMRAELPQKRWAGLPETAGMVGLLMGARAKETAMRDEAGAAPFVPETSSLKVLEKAARDCRGCPLFEPATQTVFGEGPRASRLMIIGEQPGDHEDREGHPFVGPAGQVLDAALQEAGIDRAAVYLTNAVKHFKFEPRGKRRIHKKPAHREVLACRPWLEAEIASVKPTIILCLGAVAAQSFFGSSFTLGSARGEVQRTPWAEAFVVTYHPSALLRIPDEDARENARRAFADDLAKVAKLLSAAEAG